MDSYVEVDLRTMCLKMSMMCEVIKGLVHPLVLGCTWLAQINPHINFQDRIMTIYRHNDTPIVISGSEIDQDWVESEIEERICGALQHGPRCWRMPVP